MRRHLRKRAKCSWTVILDVGTDAVTGKRNKNGLR